MRQNKLSTTLRREGSKEPREEGFGDLDVCAVYQENCTVLDDGSLTAVEEA